MNKSLEQQVRPSARAVLIHNNQILLLRETGCQIDRFVFPGGGIDFAESAKDALKREMREEIGISIEAGRFLGVFEQTFFHEKTGQIHDLSLWFLIEVSDDQKAKIVSQEARYECRWFLPSQLPTIELVPPELKELVPIWLEKNYEGAFQGSF